ncbi:cell division suppressor protein YneA [Salisediminibacterium halotolerans]|uniref:LysM domain-containing protein n=1 Tax=Salisediminibacterium halotolerans TaxID=517425 RepID=A0A1H9W667_9BACI|nr:MULTISPECIES: hypothetical protein [Salisediminibacterium]RLJ74136.1 hypothetical protein BCL39_1423 [Actinophytocola xinjiangensis]RPE87771.1 hypothetical protein EDD67_1508 [Salisediminibacterium halotolerans]TWG34973.1 hypothetical protein BCL52_1420 [Salisediminibacterium halotolerans]SES29355.1 hypothetical protein SAMN05444126_12817 [Salisediminibacterium haloalkalitolerans]GEL07692.1 hypothetical protein SHA02_11080 [Salisediminibacterium halotolerans]
MFNEVMKRAKDGSLFVFAVSVLLFSWTWITDGGAEEPDSLPTESYQISEGESLWIIAEETADYTEMNIEQTIDWMMKHNDMESAKVVSGKTIEVPIEVKGVAGE